MNHQEMITPKTIGYVALFNGVPPDNSLYLQIKYLKEEKGCEEVYLDTSWPYRPTFEAILKTMKANDVFWVLNTKHHEVTKILFKEKDYFELIQQIESVEELVEDLRIGENQ